MSVQRLTSTCLSCVAKGNIDKYPANISEQQKIEYMQRMLQIVGQAKITDSAPLIVHKIDQLRTELRTERRNRRFGSPGTGAGAE